MMTDQKNLLLAVLLSVLIIIGFQYFFDMWRPRPAVPPQTAGQTTQEPGTAPADTATSGTVPVTPPASVPQAGQGGTAKPATVMPGLTTNRAQVIAESPRVRINTPRLHGSIALIGGRIDDITLAAYRETLQPNSPEITLFSPQGTPDAYFAETGWVMPAGGKAPGPTTLWTADRTELTPSTPVVLSWDNGEGLLFKKTIEVDANYLFTISQSVENKSDQTLTLIPYALVTRFGTPPTSGYFILFEGPLGVFNETLSEIKYKDLQEKGIITAKTTGGWIGFTDKYWLSALIPSQQEPIAARFVHQRVNDNNQYQIDFTGTQQVLPPGASLASQSRLFAGAKVVTLIDHYEKEFGIKRFDLAIDWGWFYFLTRPIFYFLNYLYGLVGNFGLAILILTVVIKAAFFPLANKSYKAMTQMRKLQPEILALRERFANDKMRLNQEIMALYKREKVSPASGCLPILIQIPVFFALYKVLFVTIEMRHAPFFGWIRDLSAPDPTSVFNLFGLIPWSPPAFLLIGAWPLIMGLSMWMQQKLNPQPPDPVQAKIFMFLPVVFTFMLASFPAGLVIYWTWNNVLSIIQQWFIMKKAGVKI